MRFRESWRWVAATSGLLLWLGLIVVVQEGGSARSRYECRGQTFAGEFDECFNDYIPILEVVVVPLFVLATLYPFARFAYSLYAPPAERRSMRWSLASRDGALSGWPLFPILALMGIAWSAWRLSTYPLVGELLPFHLYWAAFALWFAGGALIGLLDRRSAGLPAD